MKMRGGGDTTFLEYKKNGIGDVSILQKPIRTSVTGFKEVVKAYEDGTNEIKLLLENEADLMYECRVCRNIFRSFYSFYIHKRDFCKERFNASYHFVFPAYDQGVATMVEQLDTQLNSSETKENAKDLSSISDSWMRSKTNNDPDTLNELHEQGSDNFTQDDEMKEKVVLQLETIPESTVAVYQTLKMSDDDDSIKDEVDEVRTMFEANTAFLGLDGKISGRMVSRLRDRAKQRCKACLKTFMTRKMLKLHIKRQHTPSTGVYPCTLCDHRRFLLPSGLIRHLKNDHKKPMRRIRVIRKSILKRRCRIDKLKEKRLPFRELSHLQNGTLGQSSGAWSDDSSSVCIYCEKNMRKAALATHVKNCSQRAAVAVTNEPSNNVDDNNVDHSAQKFMAMLKKEKKLQAETQKLIDEEEATLADEISLLGNNSSGGNADVDKSDVKEITIVKNKRKSQTVRKIRTPTEFNVGHTTQQVDEDNTNSEQTNADIVEKSDVATIKLSQKKKKDTILEKTSMCTMCPKKFTSVSNLRRHVAMLHNRQKTFSCKLCDYTAYRKIDITSHLGAHHHIEEPEVRSQLVVNIQNGTSKFNAEKITVVATASNKIEQELQNQSNEADRVEIQTSHTMLDVTIHSIQTNDSISAGSSSNSPETLDSATDTKENSSNTEKLKKRGRRRFKPTNLLNSSNDSLPESQPSALNRPVRNRVKPMNKDFVYDLSNLLRKDAGYKEQTMPIVIKNPKKKLQSLVISTTEIREVEDATLTIPAKLPPITCLHGSSDSMAENAIKGCLACSFRAPELPSERPILPAKIMHPCTNGTPNWRVYDDEMASEQRIKERSTKFFDILANKKRLFESSSIVDPQKCDNMTPVTYSPCLLDNSYSTISSNQIGSHQLVAHKPNNAFLVSTQMESHTTNASSSSKRITSSENFIDHKTKKWRSE
ncbi:Zinc finger protein [Pseudolycoriella hygida]|uniref:Zinc finger protein n=1 Tax=Pseudolycoriella hygida TaxID=35572 RepID=A0A9Q0MNX9_9DIPT|nr:Zinc finger protein [Pseudolycoriella hygida]KAJ6637765.1 Zinc finger protein [Pseudolycoriella hygida]